MPNFKNWREIQNCWEIWSWRKNHRRGWTNSAPEGNNLRKLASSFFRTSLWVLTKKSTVFAEIFSTERIDTLGLLTVRLLFRLMLVGASAVIGLAVVCYIRRYRWCSCCCRPKPIKRATSSNKIAFGTDSQRQYPMRQKDDY